MTTPAVAPAVAAVASRAATAPRESAAVSNQFGRQLSAARQQHASAAEPARTAPAKPASSQGHASATKAAHDARTAHESSARTADTPAGDPDQDAAASAVTPATVPTPLDGAVTVASIIGGDQPATETTDKSEGDTDPAGAALAGSMLALLGLSTGVTLKPAAASASDGTAASSGIGKQDDAAAALLPAGTAAAVAVVVPESAFQPLAGKEEKASISGKIGDGPVLATSMLATPAPAATAVLAPVHQLQLPSAVGSQGFAQELGHQVAWLGGQEVKQARIRLNPEDMGHLDVKISVTHDRVDVVFSAQHPAAVTAVQQSLPQLGQMLAQQGLSLGHAEVGQQGQGDSQGRGGRSSSGDAGMDEIGEIHPTSTASIGLLDAFA